MSVDHFRTPDQCRLLIAGSGAVGTYYGARWADAGFDVTFLARGAQLDALRTDGMTVTSIDGNVHLAPDRFTATDRVPADPVDLVIVAVKAYDTATILEAVAPAVGDETWVLSLQNGLDNEAQIAQRVAPERTIGGIAFIGAERTAPGHVRHTAAGHVRVGAWKPEREAAVRTIATGLTVAPLELTYSDSIRTDLWGKLLWNAAFNTATCLTGTPAAQLLQHADGEAMVRAAMEEVVAVAAAEGIELGPERIERNLEVTRTMGPVRTSMLVDREHGRPLEVEALCGAVVHRARRHGLATPVLATLYGLLKTIDADLRREHNAAPPNH